MNPLMYHRPEMFSSSYIFPADFIQMEYYVHAVARTHSFYDDIVVKLPIVIVGDKVHKQEKLLARLRMV